MDDCLNNTSVQISSGSIPDLFLLAKQNYTAEFGYIVFEMSLTQLFMDLLYKSNFIPHSQYYPYTE